MRQQSEVATWTVLIVDDEPDNLGVAAKVLSFYGAKIYTAKDGVEGLQVLAGIEPTFILLDLSMPNMDGWDMLKHVRSDRRYDGLPIIAVTAHVMQGDKERVFAAGFDNYIPKPFRLDSFLSEIRHCLDQFRETGRLTTNQ